MNSKQRRIYEALNVIRRKNLERIFMRKMYNSIQSFYAEVANVVRERGVDAGRTKLNTMVMDFKTGEVIKTLYKRIGLSYAKSTYREIQRSAKEPKKSARPRLLKLIGNTGTPGGQINFNDKWVRDILDYFRMYLIDKAVVPITLESKDRIAKILDQGTREGWTIERMAKELETDRMLMYRARLIVRTETAKAAYYGRRVGAQDSGFETTKEWVSAQDTRVRHSHMEVDGEVIDANAKYRVARYKGRVLIGYEMLRGPGDPEASAENVCNCRCTEAYAAKRDSNGRLIRKPITRISVIQPGNFQRPTTTVTI